MYHFVYIDKMCVCKHICMPTYTNAVEALLYNTVNK